MKFVNYKFNEDLSENVIDEKKKSDLFKSYVKRMNNLVEKSHHFLDICCLIKPSFHIRGIFYNNNLEVGFYCLNLDSSMTKLEYDTERKMCFGSVFHAQQDKYKGYQLKIPFSDIAYVMKRRYFFKTIALEIYTFKNKSYYFQFNKETINIIYENLKFHMKSTLEEINVEYPKSDTKIGFVNFNNNYINTKMLMFKKKEINIKSLYEKWVNWDISTFKFLMLLNIYGNRSLNDINQYPVFPWIITNYTEKEVRILINEKNLIRPFEVPMGMMDMTGLAQMRKKTYIENWNSMPDEPMSTSGRYTTHYSNSLYVSYYLMRIFPFSNIRIELQGSKFDDPNRLLVDFGTSFNCALTQKTDVRELIPEVFCFPEMFLNVNNLNMGEYTGSLINKDIDAKELKSELVNDVRLPPWSLNNAYNFIRLHREFLESPKVSQTINEWFNLIFGYKQKGEAAKGINNLFLEHTYDNYEEKYDKSSIEQKISASRMIEFGVTPNQIFRTNTVKRKGLNDIKKVKLLLSNTVNALEQGDKFPEFFEFNEINIPFVNERPHRIYDSIKEGYNKWRIYILTKDNIRIFKKIIDKSSEHENVPNKNIQRKNIAQKYIVKLPEYKFRQNKEDIYYNASVIFGKGQYLALGGYYNGNIIIKHLDYKAKQKDFNKTLFIYSTIEISPIIHIIIDETETYAICGNQFGTVFIYLISPDKKYQWKLIKIINNHNCTITSMAVSENLNIFISCDITGKCMLYSLPRGKLFNSFILEPPLDDDEQKQNALCKNIIIFHAPLPCFIFYIKNMNCLCIYSINGKFLSKHKLDFEIINNGIVKYVDYQYRDYLLIFNSKDNIINIYRGNNFEFVAKSPVIHYKFIDFVLGKSLDQLLILVENENLEQNQQKINVDGKIQFIPSKYKILLFKDKVNELRWK